MGFTLTLTSRPDVPLEAEVLSPGRLAGLNATAVEALPLLYGNQTVPLAEFFQVASHDQDELRLIGDLSRVKMIGAGMESGRLLVEGPVGLHLGAAMRGGEIRVEGDAGDWAGPEMSGGRIVIAGDAGHAVGSAYRGSQVGMRGGEIIVQGRAGNEVGNTMRGGLIAIGGACGDFAGVNFLAGTILVMGELGIRAGAGMKRGTIVAMAGAEILPTFSRACRYRPTFLRPYLLHLRHLGLPVQDTQIDGIYQRWSGDSVELNRGEILLYQG